MVWEDCYQNPHSLVVRKRVQHHFGLDLTTHNSMPVNAVPLLFTAKITPPKTCVGKRSGVLESTTLACGNAK